MTDEPIQLQITDLFKRRLKGLSKKYRQIQSDIQPVFEQLLLGNFVGDRVPGTEYI